MTQMRHIRAVGVWALVGLLVLASSGRQVLRHYCHKAGTHTVSLDATHEQEACRMTCVQQTTCCKASPATGPRFEANCCAEHAVQLQLPEALRPDDVTWAPVLPDVPTEFVRQTPVAFAALLPVLARVCDDRPPDRPAGITLLLALRLLRL